MKHQNVNSTLGEVELISVAWQKRQAWTRNIRVSSRLVPVLLLLFAWMIAGVRTMTAASVTVSDSAVSLATNASKHYTFVDPATGQSVVIAVTMSAYSSDPAAVLTSLDSDTRVGVGNPAVNGDGNLISSGEGVNLSASLLSASGGVTVTSVQFRVVGLGVRAVDGSGNLTWNSSATAPSLLTYTGATEVVQGLDAGTASLNGAGYSALLVVDDADFQLSDAAGPGLVLNAVFNATAVDPRTNSWFTTYAGRYARIYTNDAMKTSGSSLTTWNNGSQAQTNPVYCGIQEVYSSSNWVYIRSTGLGSHVMGPWYLNAQHTQLFPNLPNNQKVLYRIPRVPSVPGAKTSSGGGAIGYFVDGIAMFNSWDAYYWNGSADVQGTGSGYWNRDAYVNESVTFDPAYAHQAGGQHHYHADPIGLRYLLGDHVDFNAATKVYTESTNAPTKHSPILAWTADGYPLYGPYGYSAATNANSGVRRMISGYVIRNGQFGTSNLANGRVTIPAWAARLFNVSSNQAGPAVSTSYPLGRYMEDNDYLGDHGYVQGVDFDLDEYNGRWCVTPEFPGGTYAYFVAVSSNGTPAFPYNIGRGFYGSPVGGSVSTISESVVTNFLGNTNLVQRLNAPVVKNGNVVLSWSAIEGGSYQVDATTNLADSTGWTVLSAAVLPNQITGAYTNVTALDRRFYRVARTATAVFESAGATLFSTTSVAPGGSANRGSTVTVTITLPGTPPNPPTSAVPTSVTLAGTITGASLSHPTTGTVLATFTILANATTGAQNIVVTFGSGPTYTMTGAFTIN
jgi:hypothetical protein